jgi:hypothetical protein
MNWRENWAYYVEVGELGNVKEVKKHVGYPYTRKIEVYVMEPWKRRMFMRMKEREQKIIGHELKWL